MAKVAHIDPSVSLERTLPHNLEAERKVLGAMLRDKEACLYGAENLSADSFYQPSHGIVFEALHAFAVSGELLDLLTLSDWLEKAGKLEAIGGSFFLAELAQSVATSSTIEHHAAIIKERSDRRKIINICYQAIHEAHESVDDPEAIAAELQTRLIESSPISKGSINRIGDNYIEFIQEKYRQQQERIKNPDAILGIPSGLSDLDRILKGFRRGTLNIIAGRPKKGKSCLSGQIAFHAASLGINTLEISLEMKASEIKERHIARAKNVDWDDDLDEYQWTDLTRYSRKVNDLPLTICDDVFNWSQIMSRIQRIHIQNPLGLVTIDYLQLIEHRGAKGMTRDQTLSEISRGGKRLAQRLDIPVIMVAALSRDVEKRAQKGHESALPKLSDLRECGAIEYDLDTAIFIHEEIVRKDEHTEPTSSFKLIVAGNRHGGVGEVPVYFHKQFSRFALTAYHGMDEEPKF